MVEIMFLRLLLIPHGLVQFKNTGFVLPMDFLAHIVEAHELKVEGH